MPLKVRAWRTPALVGVMGLCGMLLIAGCRGGSMQHYLSAGDSAMQANKFAQAEKDYQKAVQLAPSDVRTHVALGNLYVLQNKPAAAQSEFMKVLELAPQNASAHLSLGHVYATQGQLGAAEAQYRAAVVLDPTNPSNRLALGSLLARESKKAGAEAQFRTAIGLDPKNPQAHLELAKLLGSEPNRSAEAAAQMAQARALNPKLATSTASPSATPQTTAAATTPKPKIKRINKVFFLTHNSPVYEQPDPSSKVVAHVHRRGYVRVIGITHGWLQIKLRSGTIGFIPVSAAE